MMNQYPRYPNGPPRSMVRMPSQPEYPVRDRQKKKNLEFH